VADKLLKSKLVNGRYQNLIPNEARSFSEFLKIRFFGKWARWPKWVATEYGPKPATRVAADKLAVTVINHATVLIQSNGLNILTDPIFSDRTGPFNVIGIKRVRKPGIRFSELPPIDVVLISHDHYDHLDVATIKKLARNNSLQIYTGLGSGKVIRKLAPVHELDWWQGMDYNQNLKLTFLPARHFSGRGLAIYDKDKSLWGAFLIELGKYKIYFAGDSGYCEHYKQNYAKFGAVDVALIPIGAYEPRSFMRDVHLNPKDAVQAHIDLHAKQSIGIHYATFQLTAEPISEPVTSLATEAKKAGLRETDFLALEFGQPHEIT